MGKDREAGVSWVGLPCLGGRGWLVHELNCGTFSLFLPHLTPTILGKESTPLGGLVPSRYNCATLPYTSRSREHVYPVYAVKLLAPAILLLSLMSITPVFREAGLGELGQQRLMLKWGWGWDSGHWTAIYFWCHLASRFSHDDTVSESKKVDVWESVQWSAYPIQRRNL